MRFDSLLQQTQATLPAVPHDDSATLPDDDGIHDQVFAVPTNSTTTLPTTQYNEPLPGDSVAAAVPPVDEQSQQHGHFAVNHELDKQLHNLHDNEEEILAQRLASVWHTPYINLSTQTIETDALSLIPQRSAMTARVAGFKINGQQVDIAIESPTSVEAQAIIKRLERDGYHVTAHIASKHSINRALERYADLRLTSKTHGGMIDVSPEALSSISANIHTNNDIRAMIDALLSRPREQGVTSELLEIIMGSAIATGSSDIHIESQEQFVRLRLRQDGVLEDVYELPHDVAHSLSNRIKILSGLKLTITKDAQDGRFTVAYAENAGSSEAQNNQQTDGSPNLNEVQGSIEKTKRPVEIEIRVSTIPGPYGEGIVMRVLDPRGLTVSFDKLGVDTKLMEVFRREIAKPEGIILTTGPTGSGKTTTLYSFLQTIYNPEIKIITIEDPIEYHLPGIQQTQVDHAKGYDFLSGLRAAMRQDPEVVMVGEIRDAETATTAVQAAQTGHLVLSTLHTNNAAGVIPRLITLGVNPSLLAATLRMAIAQRLVRKLIPDTRVPRPATADESRIIRRVLLNAEKHGKGIAERFGFSADQEFTIYDPGPTPQSPSGYKGRIGLYEAIIMDHQIEKILETTTTERVVREAAYHQGLLTMAEDAVIKILQGIVSLSEVIEVIDLEGDIDDDIPNEVASPKSRVQSPEMDAPRSISQLQVSSSSFDPDPLWSYLKQLQNEQQIFPNESRAQKIQETEDILMDMMKRSHGITDIPTPDAIADRIESEASDMAAELEKLKARANDDPDPDTADKLHKLHELLQDLNA